MLYLSAKILKLSEINHLLVGNNSLLNARALSFSTLTPVGKIGETMTVVFGDNLLICSILCIKSSYALCTSLGPLHLILFRLLMPTCNQTFAWPMHKLGLISSIKYVGTL